MYLVWMRRKKVILFPVFTLMGVIGEEFLFGYESTNWLFG